MSSSFLMVPALVKTPPTFLTTRISARVRDHLSEVDRLRVDHINALSGATPRPRFGSTAYTSQRVPGGSPATLKRPWESLITHCALNSKSSLAGTPGKTASTTRA